MLRIVYTPFSMYATRAVTFYSDHVSPYLLVGPDDFVLGSSSSAPDLRLDRRRSRSLNG